MNLTALIPLLKFVRDAVGPVSLIGPPDPDTPEPKPTDVKPNCGPGKYAAKNPSGFWVCLDIPKGR